MANDFRLPASQLTLPGGFVILIGYRTDRQCSKAFGCAVDGYWDRRKDGGIIVLNRETPAWKQIRVFGHELVHAVHDYALWLDNRADVIRAEMEETARELGEE
jgi:hypothetical protein